jgi:hypothetical protein
VGIFLNLPELSDPFQAYRHCFKVSFVKLLASKGQTTLRCTVTDTSLTLWPRGLLSSSARSTPVDNCRSSRIHFRLDVVELEEVLILNSHPDVEFVRIEFDIFQYLMIVWFLLIVRKSLEFVWIFHYTNRLWTNTDDSSGRILITKSNLCKEPKNAPAWTKIVPAVPLAVPLLVDNKTCCQLLIFSTGTLGIF